MRIKLEISYLGDNYSGFQIQNNKRTIQGEIEKVLSDIFNQKINLVASGRTDAGVSAIKQVAHFDIVEEFSNVEKLYKRMNSMLPDDIKILSSEEVDSNWHARFNAKKKTYCYRFYVSEVCVPFIDKHSLNVGKKLNIAEMEKACEVLIGEHDFSAFCAANTNVINKTRTIFSAQIKQLNNLEYEFEITGNGFLYNMVRIIVGTLLEVGYNRKTVEDVKKALEAEDRRLAGYLVPAKALYLKEVKY